MRHLIQAANKRMHIAIADSPFVVKSGGRWYTLSQAGVLVEIVDPGTLHSSFKRIEVARFGQVPEPPKIEEFHINRDQVFGVADLAEMKKGGEYKDFAGKTYMWWPSRHVIEVESDLDYVLNEVMKSQAARVEMTHASGAEVLVYPWAIESISYVRKGQTLLTRRGSTGCLVLHSYEEVIEDLSMWTGGINDE